MSDIMLISKVRLHLQLHFVLVYRDSIREYRMNMGCGQEMVR